MFLRHLADMVTHRLSVFAGQAGKLPAAAGSRLASNLSDYWQYESRLLARPAEVARWQADVDATAKQLADLEHRLQQLEKHP